MEDAGKPITYKPAALLKVWVLGFGGKDQPGVIHAGTLPGGLFTSRDGGESWELNRPLWNHESRGGDLFAGEATSKNEWGGTPAAMAYGEFVPGIHSIVVDPRDSNHFYVAVSCAGVLETRDGGKSWAGRNRGMLNDYLPNPEAEWGHDPHFVTLCPGAAGPALAAEPLRRLHQRGRRAHLEAGEPAGRGRALRLPHRRRRQGRQDRLGGAAAQATRSA